LKNQAHFREKFRKLRLRQNYGFLMKKTSKKTILSFSEQCIFNGLYLVKQKLLNSFLNLRKAFYSRIMSLLCCCFQKLCWAREAVLPLLLLTNLHFLSLKQIGYAWGCKLTPDLQHCNTSIFQRLNLKQWKYDSSTYAPFPSVVAFRGPQGAEPPYRNCRPFAGSSSQNFFILLACQSLLLWRYT